MNVREVYVFLLGGTKHLLLNIDMHSLPIMTVSTPVRGKRGGSERRTKTNHVLLITHMVSFGPKFSREQICFAWFLL